jgi:serine-type D-Ala-D-Ala carboxypeptidase (penicillin-binding protein 5/6)
MPARAQQAVRASRWASAAVLAAGLTFTITTPAHAATTRPATANASAARSSPAAAGGPRGVQAKAAAIAVAATGRMLWSRDLYTELPIASITKVMTALVVLRAGDLGRKITVPSAVVGYVAEHDASSAELRPGDTLTATQLLAALLLPSGADAAYTLAEAYGPGLRAFIVKMNATAKLIGMTRTHFANFDGLPWPTSYSTYSTPASLIKLGRAAMSSAVFRSIVDRSAYRVTASRGHHAYYWRNLNPLLGAYRGAIGIKTGYTLAAGHCLLFEAARGGRSFIGVNLDSPGVGTTVNADAATRMLNWAFSLPSS